MCKTCELSNRQFITKSDSIVIARCRCGRYWLCGNGEWKEATSTEQALSEIVVSLIRLKLPGSIS